MIGDFDAGNYEMTEGEGQSSPLNLSLLNFANSLRK